MPYLDALTLMLHVVFCVSFTWCFLLSGILLKLSKILIHVFTRIQEKNPSSPKIWFQKISGHPV